MYEEAAQKPSSAYGLVEDLDKLIESRKSLEVKAQTLNTQEAIIEPKRLGSYALIVYSSIN